MVIDILLSCFCSTDHEREKMMGMKHVPLETKLSLATLAWSSQYFFELLQPHKPFLQPHDVKQTKPIHIERKQY